MRQTTSREFLEWQVYLDEVADNTTPDQFYLAQIAAEIRRQFHKNPKKVLLEDLLLKFSKPKSKNTASKKVYDESLSPEQRLFMSKAFWKALVSQHGNRRAPKGTSKRAQKKDQQ